MGSRIKVFQLTLKYSSLILLIVPRAQTASVWLFQLLLQCCLGAMQAEFGIDHNPAWVMELESDAPHKFSRHIIIRIPGRAFANNLHVGSFVNQVCKAAVDAQTGISSLQVAKVQHLHPTSYLVPNMHQLICGFPTVEGPILVKLRLRYWMPQQC